MLLDPVIQEQGLTMLHAPRWLGKTFTGLSMAYAVASGGGLFGRWQAPIPAKVLYIDGEMPARTLQARIRAIGAGSDSDITDASNMRILTPDTQPCPMPNLATAEGQEAIKPFLTGTSLVVVDNLSTLCRYGRANDEESWLPILGWLLELRRIGKAVLIVHHQGKNGDQRGTSAKEDMLDTIFSMRRPKDYRMEEGCRFEVHFTKARNARGNSVKPFEAKLEMENGILRWSTKEIEDVELEQVKALLDDGYSLADIGQELGITKSKVQRIKKKIAVRGG